MDTLFIAGRDSLDDAQALIREHGAEGYVGRRGGIHFERLIDALAAIEPQGTIH